MEGMDVRMKLLITGNQGYVGSVLSKALRRSFGQDVQICGFDTGLFAHCLTPASSLPDDCLDAQHVGDIRDFDRRLVEQVDAVIHLAAISNDPMGNRFAHVTEEINHQASVTLAEHCAAAGVKHFVFASSCSLYGLAEGAPRKESDALSPLTVYARSKLATEMALEAISASGMITTSLRFATACGGSDRLRLDLVLNDFVAAALASREITILSDGTPWRPLIDVQDMARAVEWAIQRPRAEGGGFLAVNAGSTESNYQIRDLAEAVAREIPGVALRVNEKAPPDKRSYQVDFSLFGRLAHKYQPQVSLGQSIGEIRAGLERTRFGDGHFRESQFMRLKVLEKHIADGRLDEQLRWV